MSEQTLRLIEENEVKWIDLRFTDTRGKEQHLTIPASEASEEFFEEGKMFDGSSMAGWKAIDASDMMLMPDDSSAVLDPFFEESTLIVRCNILEPDTRQAYNRDPRSIATRAEEYMRATGIADSALFGPEPEFFVFDDVKFSADPYHCGFKLDMVELPINGSTDY